MRITLLMLLLVVILGASIAMPVTISDRNASNQSCCPRIVATFYYVWYTPSRWETPTIVDRPIIGFYDSSSRSVIDWQLEKMKRAGIDAVFVSWWGPGSYSDRVAKLVFEELKKFGLKGAILVEPFEGNEALDAIKYGPQFWKRVLPYIEKNFIDRFRDVYLTLCGKPLVLTFAPVGLLYLPKTSRIAFRVVAVYTDLLQLLGLRAQWDLWPWYLASWANIGLPIFMVLRSDGYVAVSPRYDDTASCIYSNRHLCTLRILDPSFNTRIYDKEWNWILERYREVCIVAIYSWNEYYERSEIEPHIDASGNGLYPYVATSFYVHKLKELWKTLSS